MIFLRYHACSLVGIHVCLVTWDVGHVIGGIGNWACVSGVINIISTCKAIVQIVEVFDFVGVGRLHVSCSSVSYLSACPSASTAAHGLLRLVWGSWCWYASFGWCLNCTGWRPPRWDPLRTRFLGRCPCSWKFVCPVHWCWAGGGTLMVCGIPDAVRCGV